MITLNFFEAEILKYIHSAISCDFLDTFFVSLTTLGDNGAIWIVCALAMLLFPKTRKAGFTAAIALVFCLVVGNMFLKPLLARTRPYNFDSEIVPIIKLLTDYSFPSGHTMAAFSFSSAVSKHFSRAKIPLYIVSSLMGFSRLYLCVHYPTDVIFGVVFGILFGMFSYKLIQKAGKL